LENRAKILNQALPGNASALRAETLLAMTKEDSRLLFKDNQVLYVYHNQIDAVGINVIQRTGFLKLLMRP
jgi:hypothetical protein